MSCGQCEGIGTMFGDAVAERDLRRYRKRGPHATTRILLDALTTEGVRGAEVLDIGGGVGAIGNALLDAGARKVTAVDASPAYAAVARREAERRGHRDRIDYVQGDFVDLAAGIPPAQIVTLDRVICCYDEMEALVSASAERAERLYGVVYPRDAWWTRGGVGLLNLGLRLRGTSFRTFVHPTEAVERVILDKGLKRGFRHVTPVWQVVVYGR